MGESADEDASAPPTTNWAVLREPPSTQRGIRTRASLITAARIVFERTGYLQTRLIDITSEAKCSSGTFYTYFATKEEILAAVLEMAQEDMLHPGLPHVAGDGDAVAVIEASNRAYFEAYQRNAQLMGVLEEVANIDPGFRRFRHERAQAFIRRNARSIEALQRRGLVDDRLDPMLAARALSGMISRLAFSVFVVEPALDEDPVDAEILIETSTTLWVNALGLTR
ncbi:TetR/AcrR family transcriptional regulator [Gordonia sp. CPCC 205515]|uniref:TetR/AcrR family transcriptional regulator n=1 Tax=Gordonia sp. CPCC 205515 TaxID=3140791 RepID=UPI003AF3C0C7